MTDVTSAGTTGEDLAGDQNQLHISLDVPADVLLRCRALLQKKAAHSPSCSLLSLPCTPPAVPQAQSGAADGSITKGGHSAVASQTGVVSIDGAGGATTQQTGFAAGALRVWEVPGGLTAALAAASPLVPLAGCSPGTRGTATQAPPFLRFSTLLPMQGWVQAAARLPSAT